MEEMEKLTSLWELWSNVLPAKFKKQEVVESLSARWGVTRENVYRHLKKDTLKNFVHDVSYLHTNFGIGYSMDTGFFFDEKQYSKIQERSDMENARMFNLSKSF